MGERLMTFVTPAPVVDRERGRPKIKQPDGSVETYSRISTFAKALDNGYGLVEYKQRHTAVGIARRPDLAAMAAGLDPSDAEHLDPIIDSALDYAGANAKANYGTAVHTFTEPNALDYAPDSMKPDIAAYFAELEREGITVLATELFVVNDTYKAAGTLDHIYLHPRYGVVVGDKQTGTLRYPCHAIQVAMYANSQRYDVATGERSPIIDGLNLEVGLIVHIPNGEARCEFIPRNIRRGYDAAATAAVTRKWQTEKEKPFVIDQTAAAIDNLAEGGLIDPLTAQIHQAGSYEALLELHRLNPHAW